MLYRTGPQGKEIKLDISFPDIRGKNILFGMSGGADSTILLYLLAKENRDKNLGFVIHPFSVPRDDRISSRCPTILNWINQKLGVNMEQHNIFGDGTLYHAIVVQTAIRDLMKTGMYDWLMSGENKVVGDDIESDFKPNRVGHNNVPRTSMPFWDVTKEYTVDLYFREGIPELLAMTHSCTQQSDGKCGMCYQCMERDRAFKQLGLVDPS